MLHAPLFDCLTCFLHAPLFGSLKKVHEIFKKASLKKALHQNKEMESESKEAEKWEEIVYKLDDVNFFDKEVREDERKEFMDLVHSCIDSVLYEDDFDEIIRIMARIVRRLRTKFTFDVVKAAREEITDVRGSIWVPAVRALWCNALDLYEEEITRLSKEYVLSSTVHTHMLLF